MTLVPHLLDLVLNERLTLSVCFLLLEAHLSSLDPLQFFYGVWDQLGKPLLLLFLFCLLPVLNSFMILNALLGFLEFPNSGASVVFLLLLLFLEERLSFVKRRALFGLSNVADDVI